MLRRVWNFLSLLAVTCVAAAVMVAVTLTWRSDDPPAQAANEVEVKLTKTPVTVRRIEEERVRIVDKFSGRLVPYESFTLGFEMAGRLLQFGKSDDGEYLDEGMAVRKGQLLAQLDDRLLKAKLLEVTAQLDSAKTQLEKADADYRRGRELQEKGGGLISTEDYEDRVTRWKEARARVKMTEAVAAQISRNLEDARIISPVDGVIAKRYAQMGESVRQHDAVFKLVQVDRVLLMLGVPESKIRAIRPGQAVQIEFIGRDTFGNPWRSRSGRVKQVAETENEVSKLFDVEVVVNNSDRDLKPGLIGLASVVVQQVDGYRIPTSSVLFRTERDPKTGRRHKVAFIFTVREDDRPHDGPVTPVDDTRSYSAHRYQLSGWIEQDRELVLLDLPPEHQNVVVRGQHRLVAGRPVQIVETDEVELDNDDYVPEYGPDAEAYDSPGLPNPRAAERQRDDP
ncbi:MAG: efflux RND transporter periplasmic adaptor subunit [Planctomycetota bacterium]|nr:MAG: efflux RND transporter periplasmic adaptor subunit [Planctomycetota bacterium]